MPTPLITKYARTGEPIKASDWNLLCDAIRRLTPIDSPSIRWNKTAGGIVANAVPTAGGAGGGVICRYRVTNASDETTKKLTVGIGSRRIIGGAFLNDTEIEIDATGFSAETGYVICSYQYGKGWDTYSTKPFALVKYANLPSENRERHFEIIAEVSFDSGGNITEITQRSFSDIQFFELGICPQ